MLRRSVRVFGAAMVFVLVASGHWAVPTAAGADGLTLPIVRTAEPQRLKLIIGKSIVIDLPTAIRRASLSNADIADTLVLSPKQIYVNAKTIGITNLTLWDEHQVYAIFDIEVTADYSRLRDQLRQIMPTETGIDVWATHDHITLTGRVTNQGAATQAASIAEAYAPKKVINLLMVNGEPPPSSVELIKGIAASTVKFSPLQ
jgi:pilus assembly protein CpaC